MKKLLAAEGHKVVKVGRKFAVADFESKLAALWKDMTAMTLGADRASIAGTVPLRRFRVVSQAPVFRAPSPR